MIFLIYAILAVVTGALVYSYDFVSEGEKKANNEIALTAIVALCWPMLWAAVAVALAVKGLSILFVPLFRKVMDK